MSEMSKQRPIVIEVESNIELTHDLTWWKSSRMFIPDYATGVRFAADLQNALEKHLADREAAGE